MVAWGNGLTPMNQDNKPRRPQPWRNRFSIGTAVPKAWDGAAWRETAHALRSAWPSVPAMVIIGREFGQRDDGSLPPMLAHAGRSIAQTRQLRQALSALDEQPTFDFLFKPA
jgi:hypothetical protein